MRKIDIFFTGLLCCTVALASCSDDDGDSRIKAGADVKTGVLLNGQEIIVKNANIGAKYVGDNGSYLTWDQARIGCPDGYHLMTKAEFYELHADQNYNTTSKLIYGKLKIPMAGYIETGSTEAVNVGTEVCLHLWDEYNSENSFYVWFSNQSNYIEVDFYPKTDLLSARCVKGPEPTMD